MRCDEIVLEQEEDTDQESLYKLNVVVPNKVLSEKSSIINWVSKGNDASEIGNVINLFSLEGLGNEEDKLPTHL